MAKDLISQILKNKSDVKRESLQVTLSRIKKRLDLKSTDQAACYYIKKNNLDINVSSIIDDVTRRAVQDEFAPATKHIARRKLPKLPSKSEDPFISDVAFSAASNNAEIYPTVYLFENSVRNFVAAVMKKDYGENWWADKVETVNTGVQKNVTIRRLAEKEAPWHSSRGADPIFFTDIDDLKTIINSNGAVFRKILAGKYNHLIVWIEEIEKTRNILAHNNPVTKKDRDRLMVYAHDWSKLAVIVFEKLK
ncbi:MAG: hypothetical protein HYZ25_21355 [Chloroflexi bacterium]|nr:hypothetical protein [Chloroflexota bacterium]